MGMNSVNLIGRLTADPELRYTPNGNAVANFRLAVQRNYKEQDGSYSADFIGIVCWNQTAEIVANHFKKGSLIGCDGELRSRSFEGQDGRQVYVTEVLVNQVHFLEGKKDDNNVSRETQNKGGNNRNNNRNNNRR